MWQGADVQKGRLRNILLCGARCSKSSKKLWMKGVAKQISMKWLRRNMWNDGYKRMRVFLWIQKDQERKTWGQKEQNTYFVSNLQVISSHIQHRRGLQFRQSLLGNKAALLSFPKQQNVPKTGETCHGAANPSEVGQACRDGEDTPHLNLIRSMKRETDKKRKQGGPVREDNSLGQTIYYFCDYFNYSVPYKTFSPLASLAFC